MKLIRFGEPGNERPGVYMNGKRYDVSTWIKDYDESFFAADGVKQLSRILKEQTDLPETNTKARWAAPIARPSKIVCIGLNYADHAKETNAAIPKGSKKTDWEVELGVVIGKKASYVEESDAMQHVAGYCLHNDYSEREFQLERGGQWVKGKSCDTFAPVGPWLVTPDEIENVNNLRLWLDVNGKRMQDGTTANLIFKVPYLVSYLSQFMTLLPGDLISTGTPAGVGLGQKPEPVYLKPGDVIELGIDGLGSSKQTAKEYEPR